MQSLNASLTDKLMRLRVLARRQYVTNHGKGFGMLLYAIDRRGSGEGMTMTELARTFSVSLAAATQMVKLLKRQGFLAVRKDPEDARVSRVFLTADGAAASARAQEITNGFLDGLEEHLGSEDSAAFDRILGRILAYVERAGDGLDGEATR
ncbi:MAG: MarR family transcriptional regulator [Candidatus Izemoplasmatales bacterium]